MVLFATPLQAQPVEFSVLSYNVFLRAPTWLFHDEHDWRTGQLPAFLGGYDAVVLQEAFSDAHRAQLIAALAGDYPHHSRQLGDNEFMSHNGGVMILSRWPIKTQSQLVFEGCEGSDCMVKKGVVYTELDKNGTAIHLFGLHLQAQKEYASSRVAQFPQLARFIEQQQIPAAELLLVAGDFNVDYFSDASDREYSRLLAATGLVAAEDAYQPSYEQASNTLVEDPVSERLDFIFYSGRHQAPASASNQVLRFRVGDKDLSDHHPVVGQFLLGAPE